MNLTTRELCILQLLSNGEYTSDEQLAIQLKLSKRTIQREISDMKFWLDMNQIEIERKKGSGIRLVGDTTKIKGLKNYQMAYDATDRDERRRRLLFMLLKDRLPHKILYYSSILSVSENTINSDIDSLAPILNKHNLTVNKRPGFGVCVSGSEKDYREVMQLLVTKNMNGDITKNMPYCDSTALAKAIIDSTYNDTYKLLNSDILVRVSKVLGSIDDTRLTNMSAMAYIGLLIHISIAMQRLSENQVINITEINYDVEQISKDFDLALTIRNELELEFGMQLPDIEVDYILLHISASKNQFTNLPNSDEQLVYDDKLFDLIEKMIKERYVQIND